MIKLFSTRVHLEPCNEDRVLAHSMRVLLDGLVGVVAVGGAGAAEDGRR